MSIAWNSNAPDLMASFLSGFSFLRKTLPPYGDGWWGLKTVPWGPDERRAWIDEVCGRLGLLTTDMIDQAFDLGPHKQHVQELRRVEAGEPRPERNGFRSGVIWAIVLDLEHAEERKPDPSRPDDRLEIELRIGEYRAAVLRRDTGS